MLSHSILGPPDAPSAVAFCHGILGSGRNWRSFARKLVDALDGQWCAVLVDLRNHGDSPRTPPPNTVPACAADLAALEASLRPFDAVVGHSFGGKVALSYTAQLPEALSTAWILDADPGPLKGANDQHEVARVIAALRAIPVPLQRRDAVQAHLLERGFSEGLAQWMMTNLRRGDGGLVWRFDIDAVEQMIGDYFTRDLWDTLEIPIADLDIHLVRAADSARWSNAMAERAQTSFATLHTLPDAGHWLHVDNPAGLLQMMLPSFS
jgi:pimeloyl-ACP methyl ester carboxylesterase